MSFNEKNASIIYYKTPSIIGRIFLSDELMKAYCGEYLPDSQNEMNEWNQISKILQKELILRNQLAHCPVDIKEFSEDKKIILRMASFYSKNENIRSNKPKSRILYLEEIKNHIQRIEDLTDRLSDLYEVLLARLPKPSLTKS